MIDALELGGRIVEIATGFDGACGCAPYRDFMSEALGFPIDWRPFRVVDGKCQGVSTCYIFALNIYRLAGVPIHNWHVGEPIGTVVAWAKKLGAWQPAEVGLAPDAGDMLIIGPRGGTHVCIVDSCDGLDLTTIDGGQVCWRKGDGHDFTGRQMIARVVRRWFGTSAKRGNRVDPVVGWVDAGRLQS